ncbi:hypothetical protein [uncultured Aquimarina sp.]|uniref:hypothetical protein n=1 Tax=uncultured Aquimarina sp. TaxID=575652 RepID=UPI0026180767|nr:hypothetical protein [uncultured Aquimarina sp.]
MSKENEKSNELRTISIEELRAFEGLSEITDQQALEIIKSIKELSLITHQIVSTYE